MGGNGSRGLAEAPDASMSAMAAAGAASWSSTDAARKRSRSVVLVGMRGAGKTSLGQAAASALGWRLIDLDHWFEEHRGEKISAFVEREGWPAFRKAELATLRQVLSEHPTQTIIASGGGIVETPDALVELKKWSPVVHIYKPIADIEIALGTATTGRAKLADPPSVIFERRLPLYQECCDFEFTMRPGDSDFAGLGRDFAALIQRVLGVGPEPNCGNDSFVLSLSASNVSSIAAAMPEITRGVDAVEFRADLLQDQSHMFVKEQLASLRRATPLPVVFAMRSQAHGGALTAGGAEAAKALLKVAAQAGCEFLEVEADLPWRTLEEIKRNRGVSRLIGAMHIPGDGMPTAYECQRLLKACTLGGAAAVAKLAVGASKPEDVVLLQSTAAALELPIPCVAISTGDEGRMSSVLNRTLTPVTHPKLPCPAVPGQMTAQEIMKTRKELGYCQARTFYIFGNPVAKSPSPTIHGVGFEVNLSPHSYQRYEASEAAVALGVLQDRGCGGGSVTIPLKEEILPLLDGTSQAAKDIGAVNTVTKLPDGTLFGDNTDWLGIRRQLERRLAASGKQKAGEHTGGYRALVLGAGGTARAACFAFRAMGCQQVLVLNRTLARAEVVASAFGATPCVDVAELESLPSLDIVVGTLPGDADMPLTGGILSRFRPVVLDAAYRPRETPLLKLARDSGCPVVEGVEMLFEQGCAQCELWTRRSAPRAEIAAALIRDCFEPQEAVPPGLKAETSA